VEVERRQNLIERIKQQGLPGQYSTQPVVPLEDFFLGNDDYGSIGCNLPEHPGPQTFFSLLKALRSRPEVQDVLVEITEVAEQDEMMWPFSERIYVLTHAAQEQVEDWVSALQPDEISPGYPFGTPPAAPPLEPGVKVYSIWWD
jgi:hypothetical protein